MSAINSNQRQSTRLMQPTSRTSFIATPRVSSLSSTFQAQSNQQARIMSQYQSAYSDSLPNANVSGLPTLRQVSSNYRHLPDVPEPAHGIKQQASSGATPSTVASALRRRQASPGIGQLKAIPPTTLCLKSPTVQNTDPQSFSIRRSQSQMPTGQTFGLSSQTILAKKQTNPTSNTFLTRASLGRKVNSTTQDQDEENEGEKMVESLPPLKSTTYINRIVPISKKENSIEPQSEPILAQNRVAQQQNKPSQLVKPLVSSKSINQSQSSKRGPVSNKSIISNNQIDNSKLPTNISSKLIAPKVRAASKLVNTQTKSTSEGRRFSLQHTGYSSLSLRLSNNEQEQSLDSTSDDDDEYEKGESEMEESDDDDDATTATTMTQMSDSNMMLNSANQELNSMIQMLSSSAILRDSNCSMNSGSSTSYENDINVEKKVSSFSASKLPKVKVEVGTKVVKSQSISFGRHQSERSNNSTSFAHFDAMQRKVSSQFGEQTETNVSDFKDRSTTGQQTFGDKSGCVRLPRPRSRIIFDPTCNQFHVSCTGEARTNRGESSDDSSSELADEESFSALNIVSTNDHDESSLKLLDTQNQMVTLKYLPVSEANSERNNSELDSDTIRRLKDCRGSLESLCVIKQTEAEAETSSNKRKSPVGSALRSLFGLAQVSSLEANANGDSVPRGTKSSKLSNSSIVRYASLRSDPRANYPTGQFESESKRLLNASVTREESVAKQSNLGSDLLQRAGKKLSASSSSLTSKFKFISAHKSNEAAPTDGRLRAAESGRKFGALEKKFPVEEGNNQRINGLPPRTPTIDLSKHVGISSSNTSLTFDGSNNNNNCDQKTFNSRKSPCQDDTDYGITNGFDNDGDVTILSDTSTLHGDSNNMLHVNKLAELERNVDSLKNKLMAKEKELVELQLKQLSSHHLIDQLKSTIVKLEKENGQLKLAVKQKKVQ